MIESYPLEPDAALAALGLLDRLDDARSRRLAWQVFAEVETGAATIAIDAKGRLVLTLCPSRCAGRATRRAVARLQRRSRNFPGRDTFAPTPQPHAWETDRPILQEPGAFCRLAAETGAYTPGLGPPPPAEEEASR